MGDKVHVRRLRALLVAAAAVIVGAAVLASVTFGGGAYASPPAPDAASDAEAQRGAYADAVRGLALMEADPTLGMTALLRGWMQLQSDPNLSALVHAAWSEVQLYQPVVRAAGPVRDVALSPSGDAVLIGLGGSQHEAQLWSLKGERLATFPHAGEVNAVAFSPDGQAVATASEDNTVKLWRRDGAPLLTYTEHDAHVNDVAWSADGRWLLSGGCDKTARLWSVTGETALVLRGHEVEVYSVAISPDMSQLLTGTSGWVSEVSGDITARLWSRDGALLYADKLSDSSYNGVGPHPHVAFAPKGGEWAASFFMETGVHGGAESATHTLSARDLKSGTTWHSAADIAFLAGSGWIVAPGAHDTVHLIKPNGGARQVLRGHRAPVVALGVGGQGRVVASADEDRWVYVWPLQGLGVWEAMISEADGWLKSVQATSDGGLWVASAHKITRFGADGQPRGEAVLGSFRVEAAAPIGGDALVGDGAQVVRLDAHGAQVWRGVTHDGGSVREVTTSPDSQLGASVSYDSVKLWRVDTGALVRTFDLPEPWDDVNAVAFSPDGQQLVVGHGSLTLPYAGALRVWDVRSGEEVRSWEAHSAEVSDVAFSPDGALIASASADGLVKVWGVDGRLVGQVKHVGEVEGVVFGPDSAWVASAGRDQAVKVSSVEGHTFQVIPLQQGVVGVALSPDGGVIYAVTSEGALTATQRRMSPEEVARRGVLAVR
jgi:WD40 repeat protein